jgi:hypothetical protein
MTRVIVTVRRSDEPGGSERDLELPADLPAGQLAELIARALNWLPDPSGRVGSFEIEARPPGRRLHPFETLAGAGAWDGAWLVLLPGAAPYQPPGQAPAQFPAPPPPAESHPAPQGGFSWKKVDPD